MRLRADYLEDLVNRFQETDAYVLYGRYYKKAKIYLNKHLAKRGFGVVDIKIPRWVTKIPSYLSEKQVAKYRRKRDELLVRLQVQIEYQTQSFKEKKKALVLTATIRNKEAMQFFSDLLEHTKAKYVAYSRGPYSALSNYKNINPLFQRS